MEKILNQKSNRFLSLDVFRGLTICLMIIVNTPDALLICKKENEQQIKEYLAKVKQTKGEVYL